MQKPDLPTLSTFGFGFNTLDFGYLPENHRYHVLMIKDFEDSFFEIVSVLSETVKSDLGCELWDD